MTIMEKRRRPGSVKNPSYFSQEFFIKNHADIISCFVMIIVLGLMFTSTISLASNFVMLSYNTTAISNNPATPTKFTYGAKDLLPIAFYTLVWIIVHAVIQECLLDKFNRKLHLSKTKTSKFNESGQLLAFYLVSTIWGIEIFRKENYLASFLSISKDYPNIELSFATKFFFIFQISHWIHNIPELYLQKIRKEEWNRRIVYSVICLFLFTSCYFLNFTKVCLYLAVPHFIIESLFHFSRLLYFSEKTNISNRSFTIWAFLYVFVRLYSMIVIVLTFYFGLAKLEIENIDWENKNFNTPTIRFSCLAIGSIVQLWLMWKYINFQLNRHKERLEQERILNKKNIEIENSKLEEKKSTPVRKRK